MASQQVKSFFLPIVIVITTLLYFLWPGPKHEIVKHEILNVAEAEQTPIPQALPSATPTAEPEVILPKNESTINEQADAKMQACWKTIHKQIADLRAQKVQRKESLRSRRYNRFSQTLAKAGLMNEMNVKQNPEQALRRLSRMARRDPENSAPLLFSAAIEFNRGNKLKAEQFLAKARGQTTKFDSYLKSYSQDLLSQVKTPEELVEAFDTLSKVKTPDYSSLQKMLTDLNQPELARQMMNDGLDDNKNMTGIDWIPLEYAIGREVLKARGEESSYPAYSDLLNKKQTSGLIDAEQIQNHLQANCDLNSLAPLIEQLQKELRSRR